MNKYDEYIQEKTLLGRAIRWAKLIGSSYSGGGGGIGNIISATTSMEIYHQEYHGAKNYHESDEIMGLNGYLSDAVKSLSDSVIDVALKNWADRVATLAAEAKVEYDAMVQDANKKGEYSE